MIMAACRRVHGASRLPETWKVCRFYGVEEVVL